MNNDIYENINNEVISLHYRWKVFRNVYAKNEEQIVLLNKVDGEFFGIVQELYLDSIVLHISRLTDKEIMGKGCHNLSLHTFVNDIKNEVDYETRNEMDNKLDEIMILAKKIRTQRSKLIAHLDYSYALNNGNAKLLGISRDDVEQVLDEIRNFMNLANGNLFDSETVYDEMLNINGGEELFVFLRQKDK